jgi:sugar-specific transcriptional regulator TrmB
VWELASRMFEKLVPLGLTATESKIYVTLIELGRAQAGIISRKTGIHRRSVYDALERLIEKGLVSYMKENDKRFYIPADPQRLDELQHQTQDALSTILPSLKAKYAEAKQKQETVFYRGVEGIKAILDDQLNVGEEVFIMGASKNAPDILKYYLPHYTNKRVSKKVKLHLIYAGKRTTSEPIPLSEVKYLPDEFASPVSTNIYGDKVAIIIWSFEPVAILIKNKEIATTYRAYFDILWKLGKSI